MGPWWPRLVRLLVCLALLLALKGGAVPGDAAEPDIQFVEPEGDTSAGKAASPFSGARTGPTRPDAVPGYVELSNGLKVPGHVYTTRAKRLKIFNVDGEVYEYVPVPACQRIEAVVEWARVDKQWRFKEAGSPEKVYTGESYPVRMLSWRLTLRNGHEIVGHILGQPLYLEHNRKRERFILHKRDKGPLGATLEDLVYVRRVEFGPQAYNEAVDELARKARQAPSEQEK
ncbi:MAG: hypothetical protein U9R68_06920 [Planctomycetota bacterium]|nr:hypothetical protein [Planctomycetota bacterium]